MGLSATSPAQKLTLLLVFFADGDKGATSVLGPQPIIGFYLPPPWSGDFVRATRCHPSQVTVNSNSSHPTSIVSVGYHVTSSSLREERDKRNSIKKEVIHFTVLSPFLFLFFSLYFYFYPPFFFTL